MYEWGIRVIIFCVILNSMKRGDLITYIGYTDFRNKRVKFGIKNKDRLKHVYVIGKTGMGKSTLLENMAAQDILNGEGMCFVDPHGSAIDTLLEYVPEERVEDVVYFAPFDIKYPIAFNVLEDVGEDKRHLVMAGLMATFEKIWPDTFSERMKYILSNTLLALLEFPGATLLGVNRMLADKNYRKAVVDSITDSSVRAFWVDEFNKWEPRYAREASAAIQNKIGQFTSNPIIRNIIGQEKSSFDIRSLMDKKKIFLVNLSKGQIGESNANLLGGMLITKLFLAAMERADFLSQGREEEIPPFYLFVDEFQNFANRSFADILSEARKYKLSLTMAHQYIDQMDEAVASAVFGNVGTLITFRVGASDAEVFEKQFSPIFSAEDIVNLGKYQIYLSLMIDGVGSRPFSASTLPPLPKPPFSLKKEIIANSRYWFSQKREEVEEKIRSWYQFDFSSLKKKKKQIFYIDQIEKKEDKGVIEQTTEEKIKKDSQNIQDIQKNKNISKTNERDEFEDELDLIHNFLFLFGEKEKGERKIRKKEEKKVEKEMERIVSPKIKKLLEKLEKEKIKESSLSKKKKNKSSDDKKQELDILIQRFLRKEDEQEKKENVYFKKSEKQNLNQNVSSEDDLLEKILNGDE